MQPSLDQTSTRRYYILPVQRSGSTPLERSGSGALDQRSGSFGGPGLDPDLIFWAGAICGVSLGNALMVPHGWETLCQIRTSSQGLRVSNIQQSVKGNMQQPKAVAAWWILTATLSNRFHAKQQLFHRSVARIWESHLKPVQSKYIPVHSISQVAFKT